MTPQRRIRNLIGLVAVLLAGMLAAGCEPPPKAYGSEAQLYAPGSRRLIWAVAPAVDLSGERQVDPLLQADLVYQQLQEVHGVTAIPVNRVVEVYASLRIDKVESQAQADLVCDLLGCDGLVVPTVTAYDPYDPPKFGASLQLFRKPAVYSRPEQVDPRELARAASPKADASVGSSASQSLVQVVGMYDAANGTTREAVFRYAQGRNDPVGPYGEKEYLVSMDRYCGFAYHELVADLLQAMAPRGS